MLLLTSFACRAFSDRDCPKKTTPNALVKQKIANPPMRANPMMLQIIRIDWYKLADETVWNIPEKIRYSDMNPLKGGNPHIANDPTRKNTDV